MYTTGLEYEYVPLSQFSNETPELEEDDPQQENDGEHEEDA